MVDASDASREEILKDCLADLEALAGLEIAVLAVQRANPDLLAVRVEYANSEVIESYTVQL